ncbi:MAG: transposase [Candidatus Eremiobacterota bacterium]
MAIAWVPSLLGASSATPRRHRTSPRVAGPGFAASGPLQFCPGQGREANRIRGVAETTAAEVVAEIGPPDAYDHGAAVVKLAGANPGIWRSFG